MSFSRVIADIGVFIGLKPYKPVDAVSGCETSHGFTLVFMDPPNEIVRSPR
jgi:hypothetical protein